MSNKSVYNNNSVQKEINKDRRIKSKEAKNIHALLQGRVLVLSDNPKLKEAIEKKIVDQLT